MRQPPMSKWQTMTSPPAAWPQKGRISKMAPTSAGRPTAAGPVHGPGVRHEAAPFNTGSRSPGETEESLNDTMKTQLQALQNEDVATIFIARRINKPLPVRRTARK